VNKATASATQFAKYILLHAYCNVQLLASSSCTSTNKNLYSLFIKLA